MGTRPDREIALLVGVDRRYVVVFRQMNGIAAYDHQGAPRRPRLEVRTPAREPRLRRSRLDGFRHLMGTMHDGEVAAQAGTSREAVMRYRQRHHIAPFVPQGESRAPEVVPETREFVGSPGAEVSPQGAPEAEVPRATSVESWRERNGYMFELEADGRVREYLVLGEDIAQAAERFHGGVGRPGLEGRVVAIRYKAAAL
jgi:hypothetical protein